MQDHVAVDFGDIALRLTAAVVVGGLVGLDREWRGKAVGIRTLGLVSLGAALLAISTVHYAPFANDVAAASRVMQGVIQGVMTGIGFIGAGAVLKGPGQQAHGLTTAATVWVTSALGIACALATWTIVWMGVGLTLLVLVVLHPVDEWFDKRRNALKGNDQPKST
ncbi:MAG TPA: MgtC/SapB family protein [Vitreimonas sp.]|jgi:putative Mg2+ transporter-C (MgtC) family protein|nr:MgtC/SapB family protein [Vitreimonas sp.]